MDVGAGAGNRVFLVATLQLSGVNCYDGGFPEFSVLPGVLIIETMAQVSGFAYYPTVQKKDESDYDQFETSGCRERSAL